MSCEDSMSRTIDAVDDAAFAGRSLSAAERARVARWIAARQGGHLRNTASLASEGVHAPAFVRESWQAASARGGSLEDPKGRDRRLLPLIPCNDG